MKDRDRDTIVRKTTLRPFERATSRPGLSLEEGVAGANPAELGKQLGKSSESWAAGSESCPAGRGELPSSGEPFSAERASRCMPVSLPQLMIPKGLNSLNSLIAQAVS